MDTKELKLDLETVEQVADMLWLSSYIEKSKVEEVKTIEPKPQEKTPEDNDNPKTITKNKKKPKEKVLPTEGEKEASVYENDASTTKTDIKADPIRMPKKLSLSHYRAWEKSFRSFYYKVDSTREFVLDEAKTVDLIAKTKLVQAIFKAKKVKYFHLVMVIEQSPSMDIWSELILEFQKTVQRFGVFESIEFYYLASDKKGVKLYADRALKRELSYKKITLNRQVLLTVVSDCVSSAWHSNHIFKMLEFWSKSVPLSITQMFPKRMWQGTSLYKGFQTSFTAHDFQPLNKQLKSDDDYYDEEDNTFNIPIINFEPQSVTAWASVIHGKRDKWIDGVTLEDLEEETFVEMSGNKETVSVEDRVNRYLSQASPLAQKLALYASVLPINFHVIRVLQELKLPASSQIHLAEFFLGGLIKREVNEKKQVSFDFHDDVRDYFRNQLTATASYRLQELMSNFVSQNLNSSLDFQALIDNPNSTSGLFLSKDEVAFVKLRADTLRKLGGDYGRQAENILRKLAILNENKFNIFNASVVLIKSKINKSFGTGFCIFKDENGSYILTTTVILNSTTIEGIKIDDFEVSVYSMGSTELTDLAILYVKNLFLTPLELETNNLSSREVYIIGYSPSKLEYNQDKVEGNIIGDKISIISSEGLDNKLELWKITSSVGSIKEGYSGGPVIAKSSGKVIGLVSHKEGSEKLYAVTIDYLKQKIAKESILPFQNLNVIDLENTSSFFHKGHMHNSIVFISSKDNENKSFGTGFVVHQDRGGSYVVTADFVVKSIGDAIVNHQYNIEVIRLSKVFEVAILYVRDFYEEPFLLETEDFSSREVEMMGYKNFIGNEYRKEGVNGKVILNDLIIIDGIDNSYNAWEIIVEKNYNLTKGMAGSPLVSQETNKVIGVLLHRKQSGMGAYALSIEHLKDVWNDK